MSNAEEDGLSAYDTAISEYLSSLGPDLPYRLPMDFIFLTASSGVHVGRFTLDDGLTWIVQHPAEGNPFPAKVILSDARGGLAQFILDGEPPLPN